MCVDALAASASWLALGATRLTFHAESASSLPRLLTDARKQFGHIVTVGVAINVTSELALIEPSLGDVEYVQFMGIAHIGRQGQPFDSRVLEKIRVFHRRHPHIRMQVDGGVSFDSAKTLIALGVSNLVIGSGIVRAGDPAAAVAAFDALENS